MIAVEVINKAQTIQIERDKALAEAIGKWTAAELANVLRKAF